MNSNFNQGFNQGFVGQGFGTLPNQGYQTSQGFTQGFNQGFNPGFSNNTGFGGQQVSPQVLDRIQQNSLFNGGSQFDNAQVARIQQNTINGNTVNPLSSGFAQTGFVNQGQGFNQGFTNTTAGFGGQQVSPQVLDRIQQNSLYGGGESQMSMSPQVQRIHNASLFQGGQQGEIGQAGFVNPLNAGFGGTSMMSQGFGQTTGFAGQGVLPNNGNQGYTNQGNAYQTQGFNQGFSNNTGFGGQQVSPQVIDRIQQNSIYGGGGSQMSTSPQVQRIHNASLFQGGQQGDIGQAGFVNPLSAGFGGTTMMNQGFTNTTAGFGGQQVSPQVLNRIQQNSLFNGGSQFDNAQVARIQQNTINGNTMSPLSTGFGGASFSSNVGQGFPQQAFANQGVNSSAFRAVMNADAGIRDFEGPSSYPASMYTGSNQYDTVNPAVLSQMVGRQF